MKCHISIMLLLVASITLCSSLCTYPFFINNFIIAWQKRLSGASLSSQQQVIIKNSIIIGSFGLFLSSCIFAVYGLTRLERKLKRAIQNHDHKNFKKLIDRISIIKAHSTLIFHAIYNGNHTALEHLLVKGADPNIGSFLIGPALNHAFARNDLESARLLLKHKADPLRGGIFGVRPIDYAYKSEELTSLMRDNIQNKLKSEITRFEQVYGAPVHNGQVKR